MHTLICTQLQLVYNWYLGLSNAVHVTHVSHGSMLRPGCQIVMVPVQLGQMPQNMVFEDDWKTMAEMAAAAEMSCYWTEPTDNMDQYGYVSKREDPIYRYPKS